MNNHKWACWVIIKYELPLNSKLRNVMLRYQITRNWHTHMLQLNFWFCKSHILLKCLQRFQICMREYTVQYLCETDIGIAFGITNHLKTDNVNVFIHFFKLFPHAQICCSYTMTLCLNHVRVRNNICELMIHPLNSNSS